MEKRTRRLALEESRLVVDVRIHFVMCTMPQLLEQVYALDGVSRVCPLHFVLQAGERGCGQGIRHITSNKPKCRALQNWAQALS